MENSSCYEPTLPCKRSAQVRHRPSSRVDVLDQHKLLTTAQAHLFMPLLFLLVELGVLSFPGAEKQRVNPTHVWYHEPIGDLSLSLFSIGWIFPISLTNERQANAFTGCAAWHRENKRRRSNPRQRGTLIGPLAITGENEIYLLPAAPQEAVVVLISQPEP